MMFGTFTVMTMSVFCCSSLSSVSKIAVESCAGFRALSSGVAEWLASSVYADISLLPHVQLGNLPGPVTVLTVDVAV